MFWEKTKESEKDANFTPFLTKAHFRILYRIPIHFSLTAAPGQQR